MKKLLTMLLTLVLVFSLLPMAVSADETAAPEEEVVYFYEIDGWWHIKDGDTYVPVDEETNKAIWEEYNAWLASQPVHEPNKHTLFRNYNTKYHWLECACGARFGEELHVDPLEAEDDYCTCGYHFSDNADLVTLWVNGCPPIKGFNKNKTEYKLNAYTYKDVKEIKIATTTFDSEATVELPEDLTLKDGENKFEVKVTSENQKVTKVYTVIINKEAKK